MNARDSIKLDEARRWHIEGRRADAKPIYCRLLRKYPANSDVQSLMAALLLDDGEATNALPFLRRLTISRPADADLQYNLGLALAESGEHRAAIDAYAIALRLSPAHPLAWYNTGVAWRKLGNPGKAIDALLHDIALRPRADSCRLLSRLYKEQKELTLAREYACQCVELEGAKPADLDYLVALESRNLAESMFISDTQALEIETLAVHAVQLSPDNAETLTNLGMVYSQLGDFAGGIPPLQRARTLDPSNENCLKLLAVMMMTIGDIEGGWRLRMSRERASNTPDVAAVPRWQGRIRPGLRLVVLREQGVGDEILYAHMLTDLLDAGVQVTFHCDPRLIPLFRRSEPRLHVSAGLTPEEFNDHDAFVGLGELHIWLRPTLADLPPPKQLFQPDQEIRDRFRTEWEHLYPGRRYVGLSWLSHSHYNGASKSIPLAMLDPILQTPDTVFICSQYGEGALELAEHARQRGYLVHVDTSCNALSDLEVAAAQLAALDELVSVSNASVHLAGALGVKTHVLVGRRPVWHWFLQGTQSLWYPDVMLYRQIYLDSWAEPIAKIAEELRRRS